jgi:formylglycine-generating enzyme required for sulfatase activity
VSGVYRTCGRWSLAVVACLLSAPAGAGTVTYDMVTVGNAGNANDTGGTGIGAVDYSYRIGTYEVTIGQYAAFLNAVDPTGTNPYGIYNSAMGSGGNDVTSAGISYTAAASTGSKYAAIGPFGSIQVPEATAAGRPITYVSWFDVARFANWMTNGQGGPGTTETGAYTLNGATTGNVVAPNPGAAFRLPTQSEWYKAAYYSPALNGGTGGYYAYATKSDTAPGNQIGNGANQANYVTNGVYAVTQSRNISTTQNYLTDVGAFSGSESYYGTFDQTGNVAEWNDLNGQGGPFVQYRGGNFVDVSNLASSSFAQTFVPEGESSGIGFRLATAVPEIDPTSFGSVLALLSGALALLERRARRVLGRSTLGRSGTA